MDKKKLSNDTNPWDLLEQELRLQAQKRFFNRGETIYHRGAKPQGLYYIVDGLVGLIRSSATGQEGLLRVFSSQSFFGHRSFFAQEAYHASSVALKKTQLLFLPLNCAEQLYESSPRLCLYFAKILGRELKNAENRMMDIAGRRVMGRVIDALVYLKNKKPDHPWTRREIGEFCGAQTETVTRIISELEDRHLLVKEGRDIHIVDEKAILEFGFYHDEK